MSDAAADVAYTLAGRASAEVRIKGSRFIADVSPASSAEAALAFVQTIREREPVATHHCYAYRIGDDGNVFRANDDGEPSGTAGQPILRQIDRRELIDTVVVVTRYYGGTKLGAGGLIRAYGEAASEGLDAATILERVRRTIFDLRFEYELTAPAMQTIARFNADVLSQAYGGETELSVAVRRSDADVFESDFVEALAGRGIILRRSA
jgi:uncharacterized YigZ family protein